MTTTPPDSHSLPDRVAAGFHKISLAMRSEAWRAAGERGLSPTQAQVLQRLAEASTSLGVSQLARDLALTQGTVSESVRVLVEKGLVAKSKSPDDGRVVHLELTDRGRAEIGAGDSALATIVEAARSMSAEQQAGLVEGLVATVRSLQAQGLVSTARMCVSCAFFRPHAHRKGPPHHCAFLDEPLGAGDLRFECADEVPLDPEPAEAVWQAFTEGRSLES